MMVPRPGLGGQKFLTRKVAGDNYLFLFCVDAWACIGIWILYEYRPIPVARDTGVAVGMKPEVQVTSETRSFIRQLISDWGSI